MDAQQFLKGGNFLKKLDLKRDGPRRLTIAAVESGEGRSFEPGQPAVAELQLRFTDDSRLSLRAAVLVRRLIELFGRETERWVGQVVEVYFSPDVTNPRGGEPGGIRLQRPSSSSSSRTPDTFVSDLEAAPVRKPNGADGDLTTAPLPTEPPPF